MLKKQSGAEGLFLMTLGTPKTEATLKSNALQAAQRCPVKPPRGNENSVGLENASTVSSLWDKLPTVVRIYNLFETGPRCHVKYAIEIEGATG